MLGDSQIKCIQIRIHVGLIQAQFALNEMNLFCCCIVLTNNEHNVLDNSELHYVK